MMAYAQLYRTDRLMLLYPHHSGLGDGGLLAEHRIAVAGGAKLDFGTVDVRASRKACAAALVELLRPMVFSAAA
jgi:5-methylcytosine-specific restriction enzyme subunit McrC